MKKILLALSMSAIVLSACEEITETYADPASQLDVTASYVTFGIDGGSRTVLVASNSDWTYSVNGTWFGIEAGEGSLEISATANSEAENRYGSVIVTSGDLTAVISVAQAADTDTCLSDVEAANCYIVKTETTSCFDATVKGNGVNSGVGAINSYAEAYGTAIDPEDIVYADLLWEATLNGDKTSSYNVIDGEPVYHDGYVYFTAGTAQGNAVIAVKDAQGTILWSWHIWVCDSEIGEQAGNGHSWMDRNLGAASNEPGDVDNRGLLYQWGRKDPFLPSASAYGADDAANGQTGDGSGVWTSSITKVTSLAPGNIPYSVKNPMTFYLFYNTVGSWYMTSWNDANVSSFLWGDSTSLSTYEKSIFDPCPAGYTVPVADAWGLSNSDNTAWTSGDDGYGFIWTSGGNAYYPMSGYINGDSGSLNNTGIGGYYWSSGMYSPDSYYGTHLYFNAAAGSSFEGTYPGNAMSVRCMKAE